MALHGHTPAQRKRIRRSLPRQTTGGGTLNKPASTGRPKRTLPRQAATRAKARSSGQQGQAKRTKRVPGGIVRSGGGGTYFTPTGKPPTRAKRKKR